MTINCEDRMPSSRIKELQISIKDHSCHGLELDYCTELIKALAAEREAVYQLDEFYEDEIALTVALQSEIRKMRKDVLYRDTL